jgi:hypothetical protein
MQNVFMARCLVKHKNNFMNVMPTQALQMSPNIKQKFQTICECEESYLALGCFKTGRFL